ncbi:hypothetical protein Q4561_04305 [Alteromonas sp. 1_MG-2023]|uniref:hypothetical protein n=1 Tax=Alteromonas sp. 1_MG-2023 TaxID=3062669 RepID=UPI0026E29699|nr:hypothetical protein [Alteromonas sp. 1_MG-2023]MDO6566268.1 hypothetical protein [Alteromonas sp. 1_MG-2023]
MTSNNSTLQTTAWGVCAAIADFYGFTSPARLLSSVGITPPTRWYAYSLETIDLLFANKTIAYDVKSNELLKDVCYTFTYHKYAHSQSLKVCKHCLKEGVLHHFEWQAVETTMCSKHRTPLTESCSHMYVEDSWSDSIRCKACCISMPETATMPKYERYLNSLGSDEEKASFISTLEVLAERMIRPFDFIPSSIRWTKLAPSQIMTLLEDAFYLGGNENLLELWQNLILNHRGNIEILGHAATHIELARLQTITKRTCWPRHNVKGGKVAYENLLVSYHQAPIPSEVISEKVRLRYCQQPESFSFMITGVMAGKLLGVPPKIVTELLKSNILKGIHVCQQPDKQLLDIRELKQLLSGSNVDSALQKNDYINLNDIPNVIYELYDLTPETVANKALTGDLKSLVRVNSTVHYINSLQVSTESLKSLLKQAWDNLKDCSITKTAKILRTNFQIVCDLLEQGLLRSQSDNPNLIDADSIRKFVDEYLLVNRKATFSQSRNIAQKISSCCDVKPILSTYRNPTTTEFVVFKKSELSPCCIQHIPKRFAHFATPRVDLSKNIRLLFSNFSEDSNEHRYS